MTKQKLCCTKGCPYTFLMSHFTVIKTRSDVISLLNTVLGMKCASVYADLLRTDAMTSTHLIHLKVQFFIRDWVETLWWPFAICNYPLQHKADIFFPFASWINLSNAFDFTCIYSVSHLLYLPPTSLIKKHILEFK